MTIQQTPQADEFKQQLCASLQRETQDSRTVKDRATRERLQLWRSGRDGLLY